MVAEQLSPRREAAIHSELTREANIHLERLNLVKTVPEEEDEEEEEEVLFTLAMIKMDVIVQTKSALRYYRFIKAQIPALQQPGLHKLWYPSIRDTSTWSKFRAHGEHGDVFLFSNLGAL